MSDVKLVVGGSLADDAAAFIDAWRRAEKGEIVSENVLAFESCDRLAQAKTQGLLFLNPDPSART
jgi:hypothetical protein